MPTKLRAVVIAPYQNVFAASFITAYIETRQFYPARAISQLYVGKTRRWSRLLRIWAECNLEAVNKVDIERRELVVVVVIVRACDSESRLVIVRVVVVWTLCHLRTPLSKPFVIASLVRSAGTNQKLSVARRQTVTPGSCCDLRRDDPSRSSRCRRRHSRRPRLRRCRRHRPPRRRVHLPRHLGQLRTADLTRKCGPTKVADCGVAVGQVASTTDGFLLHIKKGQSSTSPQSAALGSMAGPSPIRASRCSS
jgi:hypothetical protein